jgi:hypothetical protein
MKTNNKHIKQQNTLIINQTIKQTLQTYNYPTHKLTHIHTTKQAKHKTKTKQST